jgi:hypothetical protein
MAGIHPEERFPSGTMSESPPSQSKPNPGALEEHGPPAAALYVEQPNPTPPYVVSHDELPVPLFRPEESGPVQATGEGGGGLAAIASTEFSARADVGGGLAAVATAEFSASANVGEGLAPATKEREPSQVWHGVVELLISDQRAAAFAFGQSGLFLTSEIAFESVRSPSSPVPSAVTLRAFDGRTIPGEVVHREGGMVVLRAADKSLPPLIPQGTPQLGQRVEVWEPSPGRGSVRRIEGTIVAMQSEQVSLTLDGTSPPLAASPVLGASGVFGFVEAQEGDRCVVRPLSTLSPALSTILYGHGDVPTPAPKSGHWVRVVGGWRPSKEGASVARMIGRMLAMSGYGLIHGGSEGIDGEARAGFYEVSPAPAPVRALLGRDWTFAFQRALGEAQDFFDELDRPAFLGDALIVLHGGTWTQDLAERALHMSLPVIPVPASGPYATRLAQALSSSREPLPAGLNREALASLLDASADASAHEVESILARCLAPGAQPVFTRWEHGATAVNDRPRGIKDLLDVDADVNRFAELIAAEDLAPPLAIGLFGEWGSGKSYFMGRLYERVGEIWDGRTSRVCQIEFNAWHYCDVQLWAPLAGAIFEKLAETLGIGLSRDPAVRHAALVRALALKQDVYEVAQKKLAEAEKKQIAARALLDKAVVELERAPLVIAQLTQPELLAALTKDDAYQNLVKQAEVLAGRLGISELEVGVRQSATEAQAFLGDARTLVRLVEDVGSWLRPRDALTWALGAVLLLGPALFVWLGEHFPHTSGLAGVAEVFGALALALRQARKHIRSIRQLADRVRAVHQKGEEILRDAREAAQQKYLQESEQRASDATRKVDAARDALTKAQVDVKGARGELEKLESGQALSSFVTELSKNDNPYRLTEGVVSRLRRDLSELMGLLAVTTVGSDKPIRRIVLYIDDLDRCEPVQVVQVLQAVHLLLAFDLFVVVVAVDPRWLEHALNHQYEALLQDSADGVHPGVTAHDYLEKIFQIPFTLAPIQPEGFANLIREYLPEASGIVTREAVVSGEPVALNGLIGSISAIEPPGTAGPAGRQGATRETGPAGATDEKGTTVAKASRRRPSASEVKRLFAIEPDEQRGIVALAAFIDTPRGAKRFVNVYRLLRASVPEEEWDAFVAGEFRVIQALLAVCVSSPRSGVSLLREIILHAEREPRALLSGLLPDSTTATREACERRRLLETLDRVKGLSKDVAPFARHARRVGRYSFLWSWDGLLPR